MKPTPSGHLETLNELDMYYETYGQGEPLVLLHGFTGSSPDWRPIAQEWATTFQLIVPDMRGHGRSTNPLSTFTFGQVALDVYALLDKLGIHKFKCIGCSGGGNALLHMATEQPNRVDAMILVSATSYYPEQARTLMRQASVDTLDEEAWKVLRQRHPHGDAQIRKLYEHARAFAEDREDMNFSPAHLAEISARTLIIQGDRDFLYPLDISIEMFKAIPQSSLWVVPNAGHGPIFGDSLDFFIKTAAKFLKEDGA